MSGRMPGAKLVAAAVAIAAGLAIAWVRSCGPADRLPAEGRIVEVVDGDTVRVQGGGTTQRVRLIGVDTPESRPGEKLDRDARRSGQDKALVMALGKRSCELTRRLCDGEACRLEYDPANAARGHRDKYGRLLAFVWVADAEGGELLVNAEVIRQGFGAAMTGFPFEAERKRAFVALEAEARAERRGIWGEWKP